MNFYSNLKSLCDFKGVSVSSVLTRCGLSKSYGTNWKRGSVPSLDAVIAIAEELNVSLDYIAFGKDSTIPTEYQSLITSYQELSKDNQQLLQDIISSMIDIQNANKKRSEIEYTTINLMINKASAGTGYDLEGNEFEPIQIVKTPEAEIADYALKVEGESMSPDFHTGDIVLVKEQPEIEIGQVGIFIYNNEGFIKERGEDRLISHNPKFDDIYPSENSEIICKGLVLGIAERVE